MTSDESTCHRIENSRTDLPVPSDNKAKVRGKLRDNPVGTQAVLSNPERDPLILSVVGYSIPFRSNIVTIIDRDRTTKGFWGQAMNLLKNTKSETFAPEKYDFHCEHRLTSE